MWPFCRAPEFALPAWRFNAIVVPSQGIRFASGEWLVTDGAHVAQAVTIGQVFQRDGGVEVERNAEGLVQTVTLRYPGERGPSFHEIVIDSGDVVVCCRNAFASSCITDRTSGRLLAAAHRQCPKADVLIAQDGHGDCVALILSPPHGDGAYGLEHRAADGLQALRIELESSH
jgi:hypothetical protein